MPNCALFTGKPITDCTRGEANCPCFRDQNKPHFIAMGRGFLFGNQSTTDNPYFARRFDGIAAAIEHQREFGVGGTAVVISEALLFKLYLLAKANYYARHHQITNHSRDLELAAQCRVLAEALSGIHSDDVLTYLPDNPYKSIAVAEFNLRKHHGHYVADLK